MNLNHDVQNSSKENYVNGYINDFTDCIDFTKQYQKSCGFEEESSELVNDVQAAVTEKKDNVFIKKAINFEEREDKTLIKCNVDFSTSSETGDPPAKNPKNEESTDLETNYHPMEPDVSITIGESNIDKTINHVAAGTDSKKNNQKFLDLNFNKNLIKKTNKQKLIKKNHLKLPLNKNIKKKVALFKFKKGKCMKKKSDIFQYPDIQSSIKFKCYKCSYSDLSSYSELQSHQRKCITGVTDYQINKDANSFQNSSSSNFRITRKVYLCSACGSYYENWNLFLHMKEMHKRHICLYCLGMFSQPDKLAQHLQTKHNVIEQTLSSIEEFLKVYRGTCYLICISCEAMFFEQEDFFKHSCISQSEDIQLCPLCGLHGAHFPTCRRAFSDHYLEPEPQKSHPALGKKLNLRKKKVKNNKKTKEMFHINNNDNSMEMSGIVKKQNKNDILEASNDFKNKNNFQVQKDVIENSLVTALRNSNEDLVSAKQYNEKMLQLYKPNKTCEKVISSIQSIEDSINRVVENLRMTEKSEIDKKDGSASLDANIKTSEDKKNEFLGTERVNSIFSSEQCLHSNEPFGSNKLMTIENKVVTQSDDKKNVSLASTKCESINDGRSQQKSSENLDLSESESTDSEKLTIAFDNPLDQNYDKIQSVTNVLSAPPKQEDNIPTTSKDSSYIFVEVKDECVEVKSFIKEFVKVSCWNCVYCSHAKRIALNGKQLALHILAEHRFVTVPENSSEEEKEKSALDIIQRLKSNLNILENSYFNTDTFDSENKSSWKMNDRIYECFHCLFATYVHKELCSHNRKMHQKAMFLCIMCKSNFYTYSELLCHLCPGIYVPGQVINPDITYRCFLCDIEPLPSSFRLMVHLRRKHNSCDICFDQSSNQFQLSTHVWKHKLSHMCYRCGIAYRNKPDITKHLFWKHGTESVLCKKCLQKKWPHVYHFCVPPTCFICDECSLTLKSAVALKVHKRLHSGEYPYPCFMCEEKFISKKLLNKHLEKHEEKVEKIQKSEAEFSAGEAESDKTNSCKKSETSEEVKNVDTAIHSTPESEKKTEKEKKSKKKRVLKDVFDLPPVNLSESDDSDQEEPNATKMVKSEIPPQESISVSNGYLNAIQKDEQSLSQIVDGVWNNFQNYLAAKDMPKTFRPPSPFKNMTLSRIKKIMLSDHDYHIIPNSNFQDAKQHSGDTEKLSEQNQKAGLDHDYCNNIQKVKTSCKSKQKIKRKEDVSKSSSSDSSSDSDSSCSCGSNCSCSSSSSSSTSSNDSDSDSREKRKQKKVTKDKNATSKVTAEAPAEVDISVHDVPPENLIKDSDLDTDETETDEDFYDYNPAREANKILAEKRTQLLANLNGSEAAMSSPTTGVEKIVAPKKKFKFKKKRSQLRLNPLKSSQKKRETSIVLFNKNRVNQFSDMSTVGEGSSNVSQESLSNQIYGQTNIAIQSPGDGDSKRPKRKRVPLKFYGFSSDDDSETTPVSKKREKSEYSSISLPVSSMTDSSFDLYSGNSTLWSPGSKSAFSWKMEKNEAATTTPKVNPIKIKTSQSREKLTPTVENSIDGTEQLQKRPEKNFQVNGNSVAQKGEKLYCFCQCPYDEVSEMIACDAEDCLIEWFHFECVGIMVPPKGSWYCPDCRKKLAAENELMSSSTNEQSLN